MASAVRCLVGPCRHRVLVATDMGELDPGLVPFMRGLGIDTSVEATQREVSDRSCSSELCCDHDSENG